MTKRTTAGTSRCEKSHTQQYISALLFHAATSHFLAAIYLFSLRSLKIPSPNLVPVKMSELVHLRNTRPWKIAPSQMSQGTSDGYGKRCRVVEFAPLLPLQVTFLLFILSSKKILQGSSTVKQCSELHILWSLLC